MEPPGWWTKKAIKPAILPAVGDKSQGAFRGILIETFLIEVENALT
jgi:hypothetical protein